YSRGHYRAAEGRGAHRPPGAARSAHRPAEPRFLPRGIGQKSAAAASRRRFAVLCLDLDRFKSVNDTLGHSIGDKLLRAVASRLAGCIDERDFVARLGGDEFAVVQANIGRPEDASTLGSRIIERLNEPYE